MNIGERFRKLRTRTGLPMMVFARRAGVSPQTIWLLENWNIPPKSIRTRKALARELGVPYHELWGELEAQEREEESEV